MKWLVTTCFTPSFKELADIVVPNHMEYCARWGYEYNLHQHYDMHGGDVYYNANIVYVKKMLCSYDAVAIIDLDLLFTNMTISLDKILYDDAEQQIAEENTGGSALNAGVVLLRNCYSSLALLSAILCDRSVWESHICNWQAQICDMVKNDNLLIGGLKIVLERHMNSSGFANWMPGDFISHYYCGLLPSKIEYAKKHIQQVVK